MPKWYERMLNYGEKNAGNIDGIHVLRADVIMGKEMCGIEIAEFVERKTKGRVRLGPGTLYTILGKFEEEHFIEEIQVEGRKRTYRITEKGIQAYRDEVTRLRMCIADAESEGYL